MKYRKCRVRQVLAAALSGWLVGAAHGDLCPVVAGISGHGPLPRNIKIISN